MKIKNHKCEECGYAANAGNLKVHINAVHGGDQGQLGGDAGRQGDNLAWERVVSSIRVE